MLLRDFESTLYCKWIGCELNSISISCAKTIFNLNQKFDKKLKRRLVAEKFVQSVKRSDGMRQTARFIGRKSFSTPDLLGPLCLRCHSGGSYRIWTIGLTIVSLLKINYPTKQILSCCNFMPISFMKIVMNNGSGQEQTATAGNRLGQHRN